MKAPHNQAKSLLCKEEIKDHPCLSMYELEENKGKQIISHDLYRRQDYPKCFRLSHFISIFDSREFSKLNNNLYNEGTLFFPVDLSLDVDTENDYDQFLKG